mgnify:CR=1 FL=1
MNGKYIYTLSFNLVTEVEKATERLYKQNKHNFEHYIVDLGFPLVKGDEIPDNIEEGFEKLVLLCMDKVYEGDDVIDCSTTTDAEKLEFYDSLSFPVRRRSECSLNLFHQ